MNLRTLLSYTHPMTASLSPLDQDSLRKATTLLARKDPKLRPIIQAVGPCSLADEPSSDNLKALVRSIVFQQLSGKAASAIFHRLLALVPEDANASHYLALEEEKLRAAGLSRQKVTYLRDLCENIQNNVLHVDQLHSLSDADVENELVQVRGFGRWSAQMFLLFQLRRRDVWPIDDLGIRKAIRKLDGLEEVPVAKAIALRGDGWRPYRSVATWYLWRVGE